MNLIVAELVALVGGANATKGGTTGAETVSSRVGHSASKKAQDLPLKTNRRKLAVSDQAFHQITDSGRNCWEIKKCGRTPGGNKVVELGICPAYPDSGRNCWHVAGTFCGGKVQGTSAEKRGGCLTCNFYKEVHGTQTKAHPKQQAAKVIPLDDDAGANESEFHEFNN
jgi:hypothetical protein